MKKKKRVFPVKKKILCKPIPQVPQELVLFLREWKKEKLEFDEKQRRKEFKKRLLSNESLFTIFFENQFNDLFEELFLSFLPRADKDFIEKCYDYYEKLSRFEEIEKYENEGQSLSEEETMEKEKLNLELDQIFFHICCSLQFFFQQQVYQTEKKEEEEQRQFELEMEKKGQKEEDVDEFELAYKKRKARQKVFDYITWGLFCFSFLASFCWMFFWKMEYYEYLIFISYFWISIWTVIGIQFYRLKDLPEPKFYSGKRYIASIFEKIADLFDKDKDDRPEWLKPKRPRVKTRRPKK